MKLCLTKKDFIIICIPVNDEEFILVCRYRDEIRVIVDNIFLDFRVTSRNR